MRRICYRGFYWFVDWFSCQWIIQYICVDIVKYAEIFYKRAQASNNAALYRNHVVRIDQQAHQLMNVVYSVLHPEIMRTQHPEWQRYYIRTPTHGPIPLTGQPLLKPAAFRLAQRLQDLSTQLANKLVGKEDVPITDIQNIFRQIFMLYEDLRTNYILGPVAKLPAFYLPMRLIGDSITWINNFNNNAIRQAQQAGPKAVALI